MIASFKAPFLAVLLILTACGGGGGASIASPEAPSTTDITAPVITLNGAAEIEIELGSTFTDPGVDAQDNVDGAVSVTVSGQVENRVGTYTLTYSATDQAGNQSTATRTVTVVEPPEFSVLGATPEQILAQMTLPQKAAQLIQAEISAVSIEDIRRYGLGSVLNGGGSYPNGNRSATPTQWKAYSLALREASLDTQLGSAGIPIVWGTDAVHGHNNVRGATLFPHNIGLGATRNTDLIRQIGLATAAEVAATGIDWIFAPTVAQAKDYRWGRTYESYSDDSVLVQSYADAMVLGLQNNGIGATAKHFIGDGGTSRGTDQGNTVLTDAQLIEQHGSGYVGAIGAGVHSVMATFNSVNGVKVHGSEALMNEMLRNQFGFQGMVVSDWNGIEQVPGCSASSCPEAVNAGIDMIMVPYDWKTLHANLIAQVQQGQISQARLDEAVLRVLEFKSAVGLLDPSFSVGRDVMPEVVGSASHRELARQAVRESLVLLKNNGQVLPILPSKRVLLVGAQADSVRHQAGGWSVSWQGDGITNADFPGATTIKQAFDQVLSAGGGVLDYSVNGTYQQVPDVVVVVLAEDPYAEGAGDLQSLDWLSSRSTALQNVQTLRDQGIPVVTLLLSGRPMWMNPEINDSDAFVAAWLPGTEGSGISDVLFSDDAGEVRFDFTGRLPFGWPAVAVNPSNEALPVSTFLYERWQGLNYQSAVEMDLLSEDPRSSAVGGGGGGTNQPVDDLLVFDNGSAEPIWDRGLGAFDGAIGFGTCMNDGGADCPSIEWSTVSDTDRGQVLEIVHPVGAQLAGWFVASSAGVDVSAHTALAFDVKHLEGENNYTMKLDCFYPCTSGDYALGTATQGAWHTFTVPLANLESQGLNASSVDTGIVIWATNHSGNRYRLDNVRFIGR